VVDNRPSRESLERSLGDAPHGSPENTGTALRNGYSVRTFRAQVVGEKFKAVQMGIKILVAVRKGRDYPKS